MADNVNPFGTRRDGRQVQAITLDNGTLRATVLTHGAVLQSLYLNGVAHSLTLGFPDLAPYDGPFPYFGSVIAPVVNRIGGGKAIIDGILHRFETGANDITLHSGATGSHTALWSLTDHGADFATLTLDMPDGQGGFPGNRQIALTYRLDGETLALDITATTDRPTLMNIAHHGFWNLDGDESWAGHTLRIAADHILTVGDDILPTGEIAPLGDHPHDLRQARRIAPDMIPPLDHNYCLAKARRPITDAVSLTGESGVTMQIATTEPGVQVFGSRPVNTGNTPTIHGHPYGPHCGLAFEPQSWPDAPNHPAFPSIDLAPGDTYRQATTFRFTRT